MSDYIPVPSSLHSGSIVWAYLRDSGGEAQEQSVPQQKAEIEAYCKKHGLVLGHVFADVAKSGGSVTNRVAFEDLIDMTAHDEWRPAGLLLWNFARFARDLDDSSYYKALLRKRGLVIHSLTDPIPEGVYSRVVETLIDIANEEKRRQTSRDVKRALAALTRQGYSSGGLPPRGYISEKVTIGNKRNGKPREVSRWIPDPELWEIVRKAWILRAEGKSFGELETLFGDKLYRSTGCWTSFFKNKTYLGIGKCGDLEVVDHHSAAVDQVTWNKVQELRAGHPLYGKKGHPHNPRRVWSPSLLSGLAVCIHCGSAMIRQRANEKTGHPWPYYICGKKVNQKYQSCEGRQINGRKADTVIFEQVINQILTVSRFEGLLNELKWQMIDTDDLDRERQNLNKRLAEVDRKIQNLLDLIENFGALAGIDKLKEREAERGELITDIKRLEARRTAAQVEITPEVLVFLLNRWRDQLIDLQNKGDIRAVQNNLSKFVAKVELGYNIAKIWYTFPLEGPLHFIDEDGFGGMVLIGCEAITVEWN